MPKLAINGGPAAARDFRVPQWPIVTTEDKVAVLDALESAHWCLGPKARTFGTAMAKAHDAKYCVPVSNGTTAIQLALRAAGVRAGDEVICSAVTFIATASAVAEIGALPIFADADPKTAQIDVKHAESLISKRTTAVLGVHYGGYPFDLDKFRRLCKKRGLLLLEDCAHAQGTEWRGRKVGAIGDCSGMSLQQSKGLAIGEGGVVMTDSDEIHERAWLIHNIGRVAIQSGIGHHVLSSNYRMHEMQAALGLSALKRLPREVRLRHGNGEWLAAQLSAIGGVDPLPRDRRITQRGYYFFIIRYDSSKWQGLHRDRFVAALRAEGIPCGTGYGVPLYRNTAFDPDKLDEVLGLFKKERPDYRKIALPVADAFCAEQQITLSHPILMARRGDLTKLLNAITKLKENVDELLAGDG